VPTPAAATASHSQRYYLLYHSSAQTATTCIPSPIVTVHRRPAERPSNHLPSTITHLDHNHELCNGSSRHLLFSGCLTLTLTAHVNHPMRLWSSNPPLRTESCVIPDSQEIPPQSEPPSSSDPSTSSSSEDGINSKETASPDHPSQSSDNEQRSDHACQFPERLGAVRSGQSVLTFSG